MVEDPFQYLWQSNRLLHYVYCSQLFAAVYGQPVVKVKCTKCLKKSLYPHRYSILHLFEVMYQRGKHVLSLIHFALQQWCFHIKSIFLLQWHISPYFINVWSIKVFVSKHPMQNFQICYKYKTKIIAQGKGECILIIWIYLYSHINWYGQYTKLGTAIFKMFTCISYDMATWYVIYSCKMGIINLSEITIAYYVTLLLANSLNANTSVSTGFLMYACPKDPIMVVQQVTL